MQLQSNLQTQLFDQLSNDKFVKPQLVSSNGIEVDLTQALKNSIANPLNHPTLSESVFPGDRVAIVIQKGLPQAKKVLEILLAELRVSEIEDSDVVVVIHRQSAMEFGFSKSEIESACDPDSHELPATISQEIMGHAIQFQIHNGHNDTAVAYLAANKAGDPIHINRILVDADVVLPVGFPIVGDGQHRTDCLYPDFASAAVQERFASPESSPSELVKEIELANDSLGSFFSLQFVSGPGGSIQQVVFGARHEAFESALSEAKKLWKFDWPRETEIIVATIESTIGPPGWDDFVCAVLAASRISVPAGPIIVWSEISARPSRAVRVALLSQFEDDINRKISPELKQLAALLRERPIYLHSRLSPNEVEGLGLGYIDSATEVNRVAEPWQKGLLLRDAHRCQIV